MQSDITVREYPVQPGLGRHLVLDQRSLAYRRPYDGQPLRATAWEPRIPVLDQQDLVAQGIVTSVLFPAAPDVDALGSCSGNAGTAVASILLTKEQAATAGLNVDDAVAAEKWAIGLYADATTADQWHDARWPADDCGSSGLGVAKALRERGLIDQYGHATTAEELCMLLQTGPVLAGMPWYQAWFQPVGASALLDDIPDWQSSPVAGGHEVAITALEKITTDEAGAIVYGQTILRVRNSWGPGWGDAGCFRMSLAVYQALRDQIDLIQPRIDGVRP